MTLRQILDVLWKRKWIIVAVTLVAVITAAGYLQLRNVEYETTAVVRLNAVVSDGAVTGQIGGVASDVGQEAVTSAAVIDAAAGELGEDPSAVAASISADLDDTGPLSRVRITATADSPERAQARAQAVASSYSAYVEQQLSTVIETLQQEQIDAVNAARDRQQDVARNPGDAIAATNLAAALSKMTAANTALEQVSNSGTSSVLVVSPPPGEATVPSALIVLLLALVTGLIVGIAAALIRDQFDNRLRGEDEVEQITDARSLGELSWERSVAHMNPPLPVAGNERSDLSERLRTLRSTVQVFLPPRDAVVVITSVEPGDGKSFVSANLAMAWARAGKRVILVGGDLRRPDLGRYFGEAADGEGLADILQEHEVGETLSRDAVESRLNTTKYRRLRVLPSGGEPPDPADLLARPALGAIVSHLRTLAEVVIIDSPPAMGMADAALLALASDGAVVIASVRKTDRVLLSETVSGLRAAGAEVIGVVANRSRRKLPKTYSSYYVAPRATGGAPAAAPAASASSESESESVEDLRAVLHPDPKSGGASEERVDQDDAVDDAFDDDSVDDAFDDDAALMDDLDDLDDSRASDEREPARGSKRESARGSKRESARDSS